MLIGRCQRSDDVIEPRLKTQWFIRTRPAGGPGAPGHARPARRRSCPPRFEKVWEDWLTNIHDWNVSRQLWWGHRIPAWYCPDGHVTVSADPDGPAACETCARPAAELTQDPDIFDTWYSSGLWPFSTLGWPDQTDDLRRYYPTAVMETGYDIIFFWVARMMMLGLHLTDAAPFRKVYLHGLVQDPYGKRMSKTKGNVVDPLEAIDDGRRRRAPLRAPQWHVARATTRSSAPSGSRTPATSPTSCGTRRASSLGARPASIDDERASRRVAPDAAYLGVVGALDPVARERNRRRPSTRPSAEDNFGEVTRVLYDAIWSEFCDWGLELAKVRLSRRLDSRGGARGNVVDPRRRRSTRTCACCIRSCRS